MPVARYFRNKAPNAPVDNSDSTIPAGRTAVIKMIDFTAPAQQSAGVKVYAGAVGNPNTVIAAAQGDKVLIIPEGQGVIQGPMDIRCQLDNSNNASGAFLGCAVYYELIGD